MGHNGEVLVPLSMLVLPLLKTYRRGQLRLVEAGRVGSEVAVVGISAGKEGD